MKKILFKEEQKFKQPWLWMIIIPAAASGIFFFGYAFDKQLVNGKPVGDNPMSDTGLIIVGGFVILLMIGITALFLYMKLITEVDKDGIHFRYPPLINKKKSIFKAEIDSYQIREYNPIKEYGGWGVKQSSKKWGKAYNVSGKTGMQLILKNGTKVLFGTQRGDAFKSAVSRMMNTEQPEEL